MEWIVIFIIMLGWSIFCHSLGRLSRYWDIQTIKRENERLNAELRTLTKRDSKGRFTGGK